MSAETDKVKEIDALSEIQRTIVMVGASWCGPCKLKKPTFMKLAESMPQFTTQFIDVDDHPDFKEYHNVQKLPTFIVFERGSEVARMEGAKQTMDQLKSFMES